HTLPPPPPSPPFPYTTLFRSCTHHVAVVRRIVIVVAAHQQHHPSNPGLHLRRLLGVRLQQQSGTTDHVLGRLVPRRVRRRDDLQDRKSTRLNSSHEWISYAVF